MSLLLKDDDARQLYIMYEKLPPPPFLLSFFLCAYVSLSLSLIDCHVHFHTHIYIYYTITQKHDLLIVSQHKDECVSITSLMDSA